MKELSSLPTPALKRGGGSVKKRLQLPLLTALITLLCFIVMLLISQKYPFGKYTTVISDLEAQYAPFLFLLKSKLLDLDFDRLFSDFGYSFVLGAGKNFAGTFGYYLASPLNLLVLLFDASQVNEFVLLLMAIKLSAASAFMCAFIRERAENKESKWPMLWGIMYAFSSYTLLFLFQIMWLDGYMLLPLLLLLIEKYLKDGRLGGITAVLLWLFLSNYYIAYMVGIYAFIYLLARMLLLGKFCKDSKPLKIIGRFTGRAVLCGLTLGLMLVPVGIDTLTNGDPTNSKLEESYVSFSLKTFIDRIFLGYPGDFGDVLICNMPLIFISLLVTVLCTVYFVSKVFSGKEKKLYATAFILVYVVLCINYLDIAWQVFDSPNWFWHREAFVFMPMFLTVSYKAFEKLDEISHKELRISAGILAVLLLAAQSFGEMKDNGKVFVYNAALIAVLFLILAGMKKKDWSGQLSDMNKLLPPFLCVMVIFESVIISPTLSSGTATLSVFHDEEDVYRENVLTFEDFSEESSLVNEGFRSEYDNPVSEDSIAVGGMAQYGNYRSITLFNSNSNKKFTRFLKQLGYFVNYNYFATSHSYSAPASDAFFSVGTILSTSEYSYGEEVKEYENATLYKNECVLPLAFAAQSSASDFNFYSLETDSGDKNYFDFQNDWYDSLFDGFDTDFFVTQNSGIDYEIINGAEFDLDSYVTHESDEDEEDAAEDEEDESFDPDNLGLEDDEVYEDTKITAYRSNESIPMILSYNVTIQSEDELYLNVSAPRVMSSCKVYVNGYQIESVAANSYYSEILRVGSYDAGDTVNVAIEVPEDSFSYVSVNFAYFDYDTFKEQFDTIDTGAVTVNEADDGYVTLTADISAGQMLLTTIPYESGWTCKVDGRETEIKAYQDALISVNLEPGMHEVVFEFTPPGIKIGAVMSLAGVLGLIAVAVVDKKKKS